MCPISYFIPFLLEENEGARPCVSFPGGILRNGDERR